MEKWNQNLVCVYNGKEQNDNYGEKPEITLENYTEFEGVPAPHSHILTEAETTNSRLGKLHEEDGYDCELCKNRGYSKRTVYYRDVGYWGNEDVECVCMKKRRIRKNMEQSGLKDMIEHYRFDNFVKENAVQAGMSRTAMHFVEHCEDKTPYQWFFIGGQSGAGKTHICSAISNHFIDKGKTLKYKLWREDGVRLKALVNDAAAYEQELRDWLEPEVLYIDDFLKCGNITGGTHLPTQADFNLAYTILDHRYKNHKAITIISSEFYLAEIFNMEQAIGGRILERTGKEYNAKISRDKAKNFRTKQMDMMV